MHIDLPVAKSYLYRVRVGQEQPIMLNARYVPGQSVVEGVFDFPSDLAHNSYVNLFGTVHKYLDAAVLLITSEEVCALLRPIATDCTRLDLLLHKCDQL